MSKIVAMDVHVLRNPERDPRPHWVSHFMVPSANELLVRLRAEDGVEGFGLATSYTDIAPLTRPFASGIAEHIVGQDALAPERLYEELFALTSQRIANEKGWSREAILRISAAVDIACWDIVGKIAGLPLFRLFGGYRDRVPCYVTCAYYREGKDNAELRDEIETLVGLGHRRFKGKVGGLPLAEDIAAHGDRARRDRPGRRADDRRQPRLGPEDRHRGGPRAGAAGHHLAGGARALVRRPARAEDFGRPHLDPALGRRERDHRAWLPGDAGGGRDRHICSSTARCSAASPWDASWRRSAS